MHLAGRPFVGSLKARQPPPSRRLLGIQPICARVPRSSCAVSAKCQTTLRGVRCRDHLLADVSYGSRAAVARCGERVSLSPESRPTASSIYHIFSARFRRGGPKILAYSRVRSVAAVRSLRRAVWSTLGLAGEQA